MKRKKPKPHTCTAITSDKLRQVNLLMAALPHPDTVNTKGVPRYLLDPAGGFRFSRP